MLAWWRDPSRLILSWRDRLSFLSLYVFLHCCHCLPHSTQQLQHHHTDDSYSDSAVNLIGGTCTRSKGFWLGGSCLMHYFRQWGRLGQSARQLKVRFAVWPMKCQVNSHGFHNMFTWQALKEFRQQLIVSKTNTIKMCRKNWFKKNSMFCHVNCGYFVVSKILRACINKGTHNSFKY